MTEHDDLKHATSVITMIMIATMTMMTIYDHHCADGMILSAIQSSVETT